MNSNLTIALQTGFYFTGIAAFFSIAVKVGTQIVSGWVFDRKYTEPDNEPEPIRERKIEVFYNSDLFTLAYNVRNYINGNVGYDLEVQYFAPDKIGMYHAIVSYTKINITNVTKE